MHLLGQPNDFLAILPGVAMWHFFHEDIVEEAGRTTAEVAKEVGAVSPGC